MQFPIITLTTDLGLRDYYVPAVKGAILSRVPAANIVDITHQAEPFNIAEASFVLRGCYRDFPPGTVHLMSVESDTGEMQRYVAAKAGDWYFVGPDNGSISLVLEEEPVTQVVELSYVEEALIFPLKHILVPAACRLANGEALESLGRPQPDIRRKAHLRPLVEENMIRGTVVHVDHMGNAITNISRDTLERYPGRPFVIFIRRNEYFTRLNIHYNEVPEGEKLALIGSTGYLEIAINKGNGSGLLGLKEGSTILIEFES